MTVESIIAEPIRALGMAKYRPQISLDLDGDPVFLGTSIYNQQWTADKNPEIKFTDIKTVTA